ncbi:hypothetical protein LBMAG42_05110 [Deltaproteobacteria bacterium]|nr:hypothetical protein LBMAG42_05110 [Deltaproteobacteria bacterium]
MPRGPSLLFLALACDPGGDSAVSPTEDSRPSPEGWSWEDTAAEPEPLDVSTLAADLQANLEAMYEVKATVPLDSFEAAYAYHTDRCPMNPVITETADRGTTLYFDGLCDLEPVDFKGPALYYEWNDAFIEPIAAMSVAAGLPSTIRWTGRGFNGQTDIYSDDGTLDFNCSCTMIDVTGDADDGGHWFLGVTSGTAHWTGPEGVGTWMDDPAVVPELQIVVNELGDQRSLHAGGTLSGYGSRYTSMSWQLGMDATRAGGGWGCSSGATLAVSFRDDTDSDWSTLDFTVDSACGACATTESEESVCVNLAPLLEFEGSPW